MKIKLALVVLFIGFMAVSPAEARCSCQCVNGKVQQTCDSTMDVEPVCPAATCPSSKSSAAPANRPAPAANRNCREEQVCNFYGECRTERVCR